MGRGALFNSGFEYKFYFSTKQVVDEIQEFGGRGNYGGTLDIDPYHEWNQFDMPYIKGVLETLEHELGLQEFDFQQIEKNLDGTESLKQILYSKYTSAYDEEIYAKYLLGCLIYHQLLYTENLNAIYEF